MRCDEFNHRLHALLDERANVADDPPLVAHRLECRACDELWRSMRGLLRGVDLLPDPLASVDLAARVIGERHAAARRSDRWQRTPVGLGALAALATAAGLLIGIGLGLRGGSTLPPAEESLPPATSIVAPSLAETPVSLPTLATPTLPAADPHTPRLATPLVEAPVVDPLADDPLDWNDALAWFGVGPRGGEIDLNPNHDDRPSPWRQSLGIHLAPVAETVDSALDRLWQSLPTSPREDRS